MARTYRVLNADNIFYIDSSPYKYNEEKSRFHSLAKFGSKVQAVIGSRSSKPIFVLYDSGKLYFSPDYTAYETEAQLVQKDVLGLYASDDNPSVGIYVSNKYKQKLFVFKKDRIVQLDLFGLEFDNPSNLDEDKTTFQYAAHRLDVLEDNIKESIPFPLNHTLIKTGDGKLYVLAAAVSGGSYKLQPKLFSIPGKRWITYNKFNNSSISVVTDEGCFLFMNDPGLSKVCGDKLRPISGSPGLYELLLPEKVSPEDITRIEKDVRFTLFLLTRTGEVYSIGKNDYYNLRGVESANPDEWNQIEYSEPIKRIELSSGVRLFALSESGDLYSHGRSFGEFQSQKAITTSPTKIISDQDIDSIQVVRDLSGNDMVHVFTKGGGCYCLVNEGSSFHRKYDAYKGILFSVVNSVPSIKMTKKMVRILAEVGC